MRHDEKYLLIKQGFAGKQRLMPFFNRQNNDDLILAIQSAGVTRGRNGFKKDKGAKNSPRQKKTSLNTAQTAPMPSILSTSAAKNSPTTAPPFPSTPEEFYKSNFKLSTYHLLNNEIPFSKGVKLNTPYSSMNFLVFEYVLTTSELSNLSVTMVAHFDKFNSKSSNKFRTLRGWELPIL